MKELDKNVSLSPVFIECLEQLRDVKLKMKEFCNKDYEFLDSVNTLFENLMDTINQSAYYIGEIASNDLQENVYYKNFINGIRVKVKDNEPQGSNTE